MHIISRLLGVELAEYLPYSRIYNSWFSEEGTEFDFGGEDEGDV
jgi:hypothetical protein